MVRNSVPDPYPDPHVYGPPGSWSESISQGYGSGSGSGSFHQQAKMVRKTLIPTVLWLLLDFLSLKNDVNVPSKSNKQENFIKNLFFVGILKVNDENSRIRILLSEAWICDPDPIHSKKSWIRNTGTKDTYGGRVTSSRHTMVANSFSRLLFIHRIFLHGLLYMSFSFYGSTVKK